MYAGCCGGGGGVDDNGEGEDDNIDNVGCRGTFNFKWQ